MDSIPFIFWLILGGIQGLTEVLPISSTAHLALFKKIVNIPSFDLAIVTFLHFGSLLAIAYIYRRDVLSIIRQFKGSWKRVALWLLHHQDNPFASDKNGRLPYFLILSLIPVAVEGPFLSSWANHTFSSTTLVSIFLCINGLTLFVAAHEARGDRTLGELEWWEFVLVGVFQGMAVLPGISRLGLTLCVGLYRRLRWHEALRLAFITSIPVISGALVWEAPQLIVETMKPGLWVIGLVAGNAVVLLVSLWGLKWLTSRSLQRHTLIFFGWYTGMLGLYSMTYFLTWPLN